MLVSMAYDLKIAPDPDHGVMPAISIAVLVLIVVAIVVFFANPRETAAIKLNNVDLFAPHTEFQRDKSAPQEVGLANTGEDDLYVVPSISMTNKLRIPVYITSTTMTLTNADGSAVEATGVSPHYFERLSKTFPDLAGSLQKPFYDGDDIQPGKTRTGGILLLFPGLTEAAWHKKKSAVLTINLRNQAAQTIELP
jgi:hypothetical protein